LGSHCDSVCGGADAGALVPVALELDRLAAMDSAGLAVRQAWPRITEANMTPAAMSLFLEPVKRGPHIIYEKPAVPLHVDE